jgi:serine/threonine protein kinase
VVLYELITGRRPIDKNRPKGQQKLLQWIKPYITDIRRFRIIVDPRLEGNYNVKAAAKLATVANKCLVRLPKSRPKMSEVLEMVRVIVETFETGAPQPPLLTTGVTATESKERGLKKKEFDWKMPFRNLKRIGGGHSKIISRGWKLEIVEAC